MRPAQQILSSLLGGYKPDASLKELGLYRDYIHKHWVALGKVFDADLKTKEDVIIQTLDAELKTKAVVLTELPSIFIYYPEVLAASGELRFRARIEVVNILPDARSIDVLENIATKTNQFFHANEIQLRSNNTGQIIDEKTVLSTLGRDDRSFTIIPNDRSLWDKPDSKFVLRVEDGIVIVPITHQTTVCDVYENLNNGNGILDEDTKQILGCLTGIMAYIRDHPKAVLRLIMK